MRRRIVAGLAFALTLAVAAVLSAGSGTAQDSGTTNEAHFPWVPAGEEVDSEISIQNLDYDVTAVVEVYTGVGTSDAAFESSFVVELQPRESLTVTADQLDIDEPGSSVIVATEADDPAAGGPAEIAAVLKTEVDEAGDDEGSNDDTSVEAAQGDDDADDSGDRRGPPDHARGRGGPDISVDLPDQASDRARANVPGADDEDEEADDDAPVDPALNAIDGYNGMTPEEVVEVDTQVLPIVQTGEGWETNLYFAHLDMNGGAQSNVTVTALSESGEEEPVENFTMSPGEVEIYELTDLLSEGSETFTGSVRIDSNAPVAAVSERRNLEESLSLSNTSTPDDFGDGLKHASLVIPDEPGWTSTLNLLNTTLDEVSASVEYLSKDGGSLGGDQYDIGASELLRIEFPFDEDAPIGVSSILVTSDPAVQGSVDLINPDADTADGPIGMTYELTSKTAAVGDRLGVPLVQKVNPNAEYGSTTEIHLFNPTSSEVDAEVTFYGANGNPAHPTVDEGNNPDPIVITIDGFESASLSTADDILDGMIDGFERGAVIDVVAPNGGVVGGGEVIGVATNVTEMADGDRGVTHRLHPHP